MTCASPRPCGTGATPSVKRRLFGLSNPEGNHGEDVKELYYYLDGTPTASYLKALYRYPQDAFPYDELRRVNAARTRLEPEYELLDTGILDGDRYFDLTVEYAKAGPEDIVARFTLANRGPEPRRSSCCPRCGSATRGAGASTRGARSSGGSSRAGSAVLQAEHHRLGRYWLVGPPSDAVLMTENDSDAAALWQTGDPAAPTRDRLDAAVLAGDPALADAARPGTRAALQYRWQLAPGEERSITLRLAAGAAAAVAPRCRPDPGPRRGRGGSLLRRGGVARRRRPKPARSCARRSPA